MNPQGHGDVYKKSGGGKASRRPGDEITVTGGVHPLKSGEGDLKKNGDTRTSGVLRPTKNCKSDGKNGNQTTGGAGSQKIPPKKKQPPKNRKKKQKPREIQKKGGAGWAKKWFWARG